MSSDFRNVIRTNHHDYTLLILRIAVGVIGIPHCFQEINQFITIDSYRQQITPTLFSVNLTLMLLELLFFSLLVSGFIGRICALCSMAVLFCHLSFGGFFILEFIPPGIGFLHFENYKFLVLFFAVGMVLARRGSGPLSIDAFLITKSNQNN